MTAWFVFIYLLCCIKFDFLSIRRYSRPVHGSVETLRVRRSAPRVQLSISRRLRGQRYVVISYYVCFYFQIGGDGVVSLVPNLGVRFHYRVHYVGEKLCMQCTHVLSSWLTKTAYPLNCTPLKIEALTSYQNRGSRLFESFRHSSFNFSDKIYTNNSVNEQFIERKIEWNSTILNNFNVTCVCTFRFAQCISLS